MDRRIKLGRHNIQLKNRPTIENWMAKPAENVSPGDCLTSIFNHPNVRSHICVRYLEVIDDYVKIPVFKYKTRINNFQEILNEIGTIETLVPREKVNPQIYVYNDSGLADEEFVSLITSSIDCPLGEFVLIDSQPDEIGNKLSFSVTFNTRQTLIGIGMKITIVDLEKSFLFFDESFVKHHHICQRYYEDFVPHLCNGIEIDPKTGKPRGYTKKVGCANCEFESNHSRDFRYNNCCVLALMIANGISNYSMRYLSVYTEHRDYVQIM